MCIWLACSGYMAPEYAVYGHFSAKSDVFSYGVMVLEIVSGRKSIGARHGETVEDLLSFVSLFVLLTFPSPLSENYLSLQITVQMKCVK